MLTGPLGGCVDGFLYFVGQIDVGGAGLGDFLLFLGNDRQRKLLVYVQSVEEAVQNFAFEHRFQNIDGVDRRMLACLGVIDGIHQNLLEVFGHFIEFHGVLL